MKKKVQIVVTTEFDSNERKKFEDFFQATESMVGVEDQMNLSSAECEVEDDEPGVTTWGFEQDELGRISKTTEIMTLFPKDIYNGDYSDPINFMIGNLEE
ncbi:hypothetical protein [Faecalibaculum rodentium]|uniref:Uncharacterized protein n=1 Tax=Faecalibaculum rodentium TaxID=1702221 RepID=A0A140DSY5_9FIRM|nr:hypothetical protein [Faecalibaculum rodentium]AMK53762.1 hypothetical protein AALO17_06280 [Faecalibaculum rodentium]OLU44519.1 hypothetical protein BO223_08005 [Faecalibaculum rodentium]